MLALTIENDEWIQVGEDIRVKVRARQWADVNGVIHFSGRIYFDAPRDVRIVRDTATKRKDK